MLRAVLLGLAHNEQAKNLAMSVPATRSLVRRFVPGETDDDVVRAGREMSASGLQMTVDYLGEDTTDLAQATLVTEAYLALLEKLSEAGLTGGAEVSVKLSAIGQFLGPQGEEIALRHARAICTAARNAGTTVTLDMEDHTTTDSTLRILAELRKDFSTTGAVIQAYLYRSLADCAALASEGSRVRLCKGAYSEPAEVAYTKESDIDLAYVRCLRVLMEGAGYPMLATHDPRLIAIGLDLAARNHRSDDSYEFQMLYGIRPNEQRRLAELGHQVRVYTPYGNDWWGYLVRRLAEKPANLTFFLRGLVSKN